MKYLFEGLPIYTMDSTCGVVEAMVVQESEIVAVGERARLMSEHPSARVVSLDGGAVIPCFNDSHAHLLLLGQDLMRCDLSHCRSTAQVIQALQRWRAQNSSLPWIMGWNFDWANFEKNGPRMTGLDLDPTFGDRPVIIYHQTKHALLANTAALDAAGVTAATPTPRGGIIERDQAGKPNGVFREMAAMAMIERALPDPGIEGTVNALRAATAYLAGYGILAATEALAGNWYSLEGKIAAYNRLLEGGAPVRITLLPDFAAAEKSGWLEQWPAKDLALHPNLRLGPLKLIADGAITSRTAALHHPYEGSTERGILTLDEQTLAHRLALAQAAGRPTATHAIGDLAIQITLEAIENAQCANPVNGLCHRIEHAILLSTGLIGRIAAARIMISAQPQLLMDMGDGHLKAVGERAEREMPLKSLLMAGVNLSFGSDVPVVDGDPIKGWRTAVTRRTSTGRQLGPDQALKPLEALRCYTVGSAVAGNDEAVGTLMPGKQARFAVLSHRPERIADEEMKVVGVSHQYMEHAF